MNLCHRQVLVFFRLSHTPSTTIDVERLTNADRHYASATIVVAWNMQNAHVNPADSAAFPAMEPMTSADLSARGS